jgi:hypothetical protein
VVLGDLLLFLALFLLLVVSLLLVAVFTQMAIFATVTTRGFGDFVGVDVGAMTAVMLP